MQVKSGVDGMILLVQVESGVDRMTLHMQGRTWNVCI